MNGTKMKGFQFPDQVCDGHCTGDRLCAVRLPHRRTPALRPEHVQPAARQNGYVLVMACGMLLCILTGGNIDLAVGSVICLVGGLAAVMITNLSINPVLTIVVCLVAGLLVGIWQGYWIGYVRIPPFITTLGGMFIFRGIGRLILDNKTVAVQDSTFLNIFTMYIKVPGLDDGDTVYSALIVGVCWPPCWSSSTPCAPAATAPKNGYRQNSAVSDYVKSGLIAALILYYC